MIVLVRTVLEMLVMFSLVGGAMALYADWKIIYPPGWRIVILGFLTVLAANAMVLLWVLTEKRGITWNTWVLFSSYVFLFTALYTTRLHNRIFGKRVIHG